MLIKGNPGKAVNSAYNLPPNQVFLAELIVAIESSAVKHGAGSSFYSPSSMQCIRQMYYKRTGEPRDASPVNYGDVGCAATGTARHEHIQDALIYLSKGSSRFKYIDVAEYVNHKQRVGKCTQLILGPKLGAEQQLIDEKRHIRFQCDGIIYDIQDKEFYLFEFKNQISFKALNKQSVDVAHHNQVAIYCAELDLNKALVTYEDRNSCTLYVPEVFEVTDYEKARIYEKVDSCENMVKQAIIPARPDDLSSATCRYCNYKSKCKADGKEARSNGTNIIK